MQLFLGFFVDRIQIWFDFSTISDPYNYIHTVFGIMIIQLREIF